MCVCVWGGDGERGIGNHLRSLLESRAVITGLRGGGKQQRHTQDKSSTRVLLTMARGEDRKHTADVTHLSVMEEKEEKRQRQRQGDAQLGQRDFICSSSPFSKHEGPWLTFQPWISVSWRQSLTWREVGLHTWKERKTKM